MSSNKHLITTAIAYGNAAPHIGHAFEFVTADTHARFRKSIGEDVYFITGMDEHGQKIEQKAKELGIPIKEFIDTNAQSFIDIDKNLSVEYDFFVRTSDKEKHYGGAQLLWKKLVDAGTIEKRAYSALYCIGCEEFKTEKDLNEQGECLIHRTKPEVVEEENYFFKLSSFTDEIKRNIENNELKIYPNTRRNEILAQLERGLEDVSFSRPTSKVAWGIPVPGDDTQVMYVWCDALSNYITALGYGTDAFNEELWSNTTHIIGKDILRFHAAIWPGMLLAAGLPLPKEILVHGFITSGGHKMSKSLGNVINPQELLDMFKEASGELAGDALRFILLHEVPSFEDGDMTLDSIKASYTANLANGIGNLTNRIMKMATTYGVDTSHDQYMKQTHIIPLFFNDMNNFLMQFEVSDAVKKLMAHVHAVDEYIQQNEPFKVIKTNPEKAKEDVAYALAQLNFIAQELSCFLPGTSGKILECIRENKMPEKPLFNRLP